VAWDTLKSHKVRSSLTLLGIVIGVTSVISTAAVIEGLNRYIQEKVEKLGSRTFFITRFPPGTDPNRMPEKIRLRRFLEYSDAARLTAQCRAVEAPPPSPRAPPSSAGQRDPLRFRARAKRLPARGRAALRRRSADVRSRGGPLHHALGRGTRLASGGARANVAEALFPRLDPLARTSSSTVACTRSSHLRA